MFEVNVIGTLQVTKALLPAPKASGEGIIVNVGSIAGRTAYEGGAGYTAAKHGLAVMTETMRLELVDQPVRVTEIAPGMVRTEGFALTRFGGDQERADAVYAGVPSRRRGRRRGHRVDGDLACPRQRRPAGDRRGPGGGPQGALRALTTERVARGRHQEKRIPDRTGGAHGLQVPLPETSIPMRGATSGAPRSTTSVPPGCPGKPSPGWNASRPSPSAPELGAGPLDPARRVSRPSASRWPDRGGRCSPGPPASAVPSSQIVVGLV